jgi:ADP-heptose:LPS heptosyltransferase
LATRPNILLVRLRLVGDVVFTTPLISALRRRYPDASISYLVEPAAAPIVQHNPDLSQVIVAPHRRGLGRIADDIALARRLRGMLFDVALDLHGGPRGAWLTWASGAKTRIGYNIKGRSWMYTTVVDRPRELRPRHSVENQWDLLPALDAAFAAGPDRRIDRVRIPVDAAAASAISNKLAAWAVPAGARVILIHVSAGNPFRRWPESAFADLATSLITAGPDRYVIFTGGPSDREATARVLELSRRQLTPPSPAASAFAKAPSDKSASQPADRLLDGEAMSLPELRALCDRAALYIGGDSGPLHMASASDVPIVGLFGPTLAERSAPWRPPEVPSVSVDAGPLPCRPCDQRVCAPGDFRCLTTLAAASVVDAAERLLAIRTGETAR